MFWNLIRMPTEVIVFPVINEGVGSVFATNGMPSRKKYTKKRQQFLKDRRKRRFDRRKSVREGVIVTLSTIENRRSGRDRRQVV